jgi:hypothetical protein
MDLYCGVVSVILDFKLLNWKFMNFKMKFKDSTYIFSIKVKIEFIATVFFLNRLSLTLLLYIFMNLLRNC